MQAMRSHAEIRDVNTRYHDVAAGSYDAKWGIDFGATGRAQVLGKLRKLLGADAGMNFPRALEVGCGTGYFGLNLVLADVIGELVCTDISPGMIAALRANADRLGLSERVSAVRAAAGALPFPDASFDVVLGHAVLHHLPDLELAFSEFMRVLRPGGRVLFAGEPSRMGDLLARIPKRAGCVLAPVWRSLIGASPAPVGAGPGSAPHHDQGDNLDLDQDQDQDQDHEQDHDQGNNQDHELELESRVDVHAFRPSELEAIACRGGFTDVSVRGEELIANWFGWFNRVLEASAAPEDVPMLWRRYAFHGYLALQKLDQWALEPRLPAAAFYNLLLAARRPS